MKNQPRDLDDRLLTLPELATIVGRCTQTVMSMVGKGQLPRPIKIACGIRWFRSDVLAYLRELPREN